MVQIKRDDGTVSEKLVVIEYVNLDRCLNVIFDDEDSWIVVMKDPEHLLENHWRFLCSAHETNIQKARP